MKSNLPIVFSEHQFRSYLELGLSPQDPALEAIERINAAAGCEILRLERKGIRAQDRVGLVRAGAMTIEILPKIEAPGVEAGRNLLAMLSYAYASNAYAFPIQVEAEASLNNGPGGWFELLTRMFASHLEQQLSCGIVQSYVQRESSLPVLRGRWDLARQARRPGYERHSFEVSYEELTTDTLLNQVFKRVVDDLGLLSSDRTNLALLASLRDRLEAVSLLNEVPPGLLEAVHFNRINERFRPAFTLARLFLSGSIPGLRAGDLPAYAFVMAMSRLFERFTAGFLNRFKTQILPRNWQEAEMVVQGTGRRAYLAECEGRGVLRLIPDLVIRRRGASIPLLVGDTKYRLFDGEIAREDAYQMLAYLARLGCRRGLLLYPQPQGGGAIRRRWVIETPAATIDACTLNLRHPLDNPGPLITELAEIFAGLQAGESTAGLL
jgi:5-methylcytosine-specific restriction enzyme subunit McrC